MDTPVSSVLLWGVSWSFSELHDCGQAPTMVSLHIQFSEDTAGPAQTPVALTLIHSSEVFLNAYCVQSRVSDTVKQAEK